MWESESTQAYSTSARLRSRGRWRGGGGGREKRRREKEKGRGRKREDILWRRAVIYEQATSNSRRGRGKDCNKTRGRRSKYESKIPPPKKKAGRT